MPCPRGPEWAVIDPGPARQVTEDHVDEYGLRLVLLRPPAAAGIGVDHRGVRQTCSAVEALNGVIATGIRRTQDHPRGTSERASVLDLSTLGSLAQGREWRGRLGPRVSRIPTAFRLRLIAGP